MSRAKPSRGELATVVGIVSVPSIRCEADLIAAVNGEHDQANLSVRRGIGHAQRAGELLRRAKRLCVHGAWTPWIKENLRFSVRTAQLYMRLAANWAEVEAKTQDVAVLTLREAVRLLTKDKIEEPHAGRPDNLTLPGMPLPTPSAAPALGFTITKQLAPPTPTVADPPNDVDAFIRSLLDLSRRAEAISAKTLAAAVAPENVQPILHAGKAIAELLTILMADREQEAA